MLSMSSTTLRIQTDIEQSSVGWHGWQACTFVSHAIIEKLLTLQRVPERIFTYPNKRRYALWLVQLFEQGILEGASKHQAFCQQGWGWRHSSLAYKSIADAYNSGFTNTLLPAANSAITKAHLTKDFFESMRMQFEELNSDAASRLSANSFVNLSLPGAPSVDATPEDSFLDTPAPTDNNHISITYDAENCRFKSRKNQQEEVTDEYGYGYGIVLGTNKHAIALVRIRNEWLLFNSQGENVWQRGYICCFSNTQEMVSYLQNTLYRDIPPGQIGAIQYNAYVCQPSIRSQPQAART